MSTATDNRDVARTAIEQVCARGDMDLAPSCYAEDFADYFASSEYHGLEGVRKSTELYRALSSGPLPLTSMTPLSQPVTAAGPICRVGRHRPWEAA
jgi:hypothetical protein